MFYFLIQKSCMVVKVLRLDTGYVLFKSHVMIAKMRKLHAVEGMLSILTKQGALLTSTIS